MRARGQSTSWFDAAVSRHFPDVRRQQIEAFLADPHPDPKAAAGAYRHFAIDDTETTTDQRLALTRKMIALDPANPLYAGRLLALYAEKQDWAALAPALQAYVAAHRDDDTAATMLAMVYRLLDRSDQATAVATAAGVDPDDADWWCICSTDRARCAAGAAAAASRACSTACTTPICAMTPRAPR